MRERAKSLLQPQPVSTMLYRFETVDPTYRRLFRSVLALFIYLQEINYWTLNDELVISLISYVFLHTKGMLYTRAQARTRAYTMRM